MTTHQKKPASALSALALSALALGCGASQSPAPEAGFGSPDPDALAFAEAHDAAWNAHDPDAMTALFVADGTLVTPRGDKVEGAAALRELFASLGPTKSTTSKVRVTSMQWLAPDLALLDMTQTLEGPGTQKMSSNQAHLTAVARKQDGAFKIVAARVIVPVSR